MIITTEENVFHFPFGIKEGLLNLEPYEFTYPVLEKEGKVYLAVEPLQGYISVGDHHESAKEQSEHL